MIESYFSDEARAVVASLVGAVIDAVELEGTNEDDTYPQIRLLLADGRLVRIGGVWHNDSTAGVWVEVDQ